MVSSNGHLQLLAYFLGALLLFICLLPRVEGMELECKALDPQRKKDLETVLGRPFIGCGLSTRKSIKALRRISWLTPPGEQGSIDIATQKDYINSELDRAGFGHQEKQMVMMGFRIASLSINNPGMLTVSTSCVMSLEPDFVTMLLVDSRSPDRFNMALARECQRRGIELDASVRDLTKTEEVVVFVRYIVWTVISFLVPFAGQVAIAIMKAVVQVVTTFVPCPSNPARIIFSS